MAIHRPADPSDLEPQRIELPGKGMPMCDITPDARATFSKSLQSPGLARDFVHENGCAEHGARGSVALELLASELVTNAVLYGEAPITMKIACSVYSMRLEVHHENRAAEAGVESPADGLGFLLVDKVAQEWGATLTATGKTIWCTVPTGVLPQGRRPEAARRVSRHAGVEEAGSGAHRRTTKLWA